MNHLLSDLQLVDFTDRLASRAPVPGGGATAALIGALASALASMAVNLTEGKKKFLAYKDDYVRMLRVTTDLRHRFLSLIREDAAAFEPLSKLYNTEREAPDYEARMRIATLNACRAPLEMMRCCAKLIVLLEELLPKCSALLLSDVGCSALAARAALESAAMNVFVNTRLFPEDSEAREFAGEAEEILDREVPRAQKISEAVMASLRKERDTK